MIEMVERVARAIGNRVAQGRTEEEGETDLGWDFWPDAYQENMRELARAAIAAMRAPTEAMINAGTDACYGYREAAVCSWPDMIDAALQPITPPEKAL